MSWCKLDRAPIVFNAKCAIFTTVDINDFALLMTYLFTNKGCLQEALDIAIIDPPLIASARE
jgi:hypothetical protein